MRRSGCRCSPESAKKTSRLVAHVIWLVAPAEAEICSSSLRKRERDAWFRLIRSQDSTTSDILCGGVGFATSDFSQEVRMKKVLLVLTLVGLGFLAWRYFSNEPV